MCRCSQVLNACCSIASAFGKAVLLQLLAAYEIPKEAGIDALSTCFSYEVDPIISASLEVGRAIGSQAANGGAGGRRKRMAWLSCGAGNAAQHVLRHCSVVAVRYGSMADGGFKRHRNGMAAACGQVLPLKHSPNRFSLTVRIH
ncbi:hypothetical protein NPIL_188001 [Nephila pilipes]|uniref:Uncharacterized protein n=1 Tax=Nephila pilipes TaxID=299642 RepID=A0A8X6QS32_NEPPI|nr:hypothetical protein NPIL_188001 [Nephila pilipes]